MYYSHYVNGCNLIQNLLREFHHLSVHYNYRQPILLLSYIFDRHTIAYISDFAGYFLLECFDPVSSTSWLILSESGYPFLLFLVGTADWYLIKLVFRTQIRSLANFSRHDVSSKLYICELRHLHL